MPWFPFGVEELLPVVFRPIGAIPLSMLVSAVKIPVIVSVVQYCTVLYKGKILFLAGMTSVRFGCFEVVYGFTPY